MDTTKSTNRSCINECAEEKKMSTKRSVGTSTILLCIGVSVAIVLSLIAVFISAWAASQSSGVCQAETEWREQVDVEIAALSQQASSNIIQCQCIDSSSTTVTPSNSPSSATPSNSPSSTAPSNTPRSTTTPSVSSNTPTPSENTNTPTQPQPTSANAITITINGQAQTKYVLAPEWAKQYLRMNRTSVTLNGGGRAYIGDSPSSPFTTDSFYQMPLLGKQFTFDVDLSNVGCSCNGALYFVSMPGHNSNQQPAPGEHGDFYCDGNAVGGTYCPEMDVLESNKYAMSSTAHTCDYVAPSYYRTCDGDGCGTSILDVNSNAFGPGRQINTNQPFTLSVSFITGSNGLLSTVTNHFTQGDQSFQFNSCHSDYLQWMGYSLPGIVMTMSLWGTGPNGLAWLDGRSGCQGGCNLAATSVTFSNFRLDDL